MGSLESGYEVKFLLGTGSFDQPFVAEPCGDNDWGLVVKVFFVYCVLFTVPS